MSLRIAFPLYYFTKNFLFENSLFHHKKIIWLYLKHYCKLFRYQFYQLPVLNGEAGKPSLLYKLHPSGLLLHA